MKLADKIVGWLGLRDPVIASVYAVTAIGNTVLTLVEWVR